MHEQRSTKPYGLLFFILIGVIGSQIVSCRQRMAEIRNKTPSISEQGFDTHGSATGVSPETRP